MQMCEEMLNTQTKNSRLLVGIMQCGHLLFTGIILHGVLEDVVSSKLHVRLSRASLYPPPPSLLVIT